MDVSDKAMTLRAQEHGHQPIVCYEAEEDATPIAFAWANAKSAGLSAGEKAPTIKASKNGMPAVVYDGRGNGDGKICPTLIGDHENRVTDYTAIVSCVQTSFGEFHESDKGQTLKASDGRRVDPGAVILEPGKPPQKYILRRLTPTECARLQGFPDWWTDGANGSDSAIYKMWGNGIALPCAADVMGRVFAALSIDKEAEERA